MGDLGAGKTHFTQGFARALDVTDRVTSPTFTLANRYEGLVVNHLDAYRAEQLAEAEDLPSNCSRTGSPHRGGDLILPALPTDLLEVRITLGKPTTTVASRSPRSGWRGRNASRSLPTRRRNGRSADAHLGIESATGRVGCAIGGHEGVIASAHSSRGRRHAEALAPQIRFVSEQAGVALDEIGLVAVDIGPGLYTGLRVGVTTALAIATTLRVPMIGVTSLDLLAFPLARRSPDHCGHRRPPQRGFPCPTGRSPAGATDHGTGGRDAGPGAFDDVADDEDVLLAGDGVVPHRDVFEGVRHATSRTMRMGSCRLPPSSAWPMLARRGIRPSRSDRTALSRRPDAEAKWDAGP